jgi:hypothetical protein
MPPYHRATLDSFLKRNQNKLAKSSRELLPSNKCMFEGLSFPLVPGLIVGTFLVSLLSGDANHPVWQGLGCASAGIKP